MAGKQCRELLISAAILRFKTKSTLLPSLLERSRIMKRPLTAMALFLSISLVSTYSAFPAQKTSVTLKKAGRTTATLPNTILSGSGVPSKTIGIDGDFYIDIKNANLYGPKLKGVWKLVTSLRLPSEKSITSSSLIGVDGATGSTGAVGATGSTGAVGATGAKGVQGVQGIQGVQGDQGNVGAVGLQGVQGIGGLTGLQGDTGANGLQGLTGSAGSKGETGATGSTGAQGAAGATGAQGAAGTNGTQGATGAAGTNGTQGAQGLQGAVGAAGTNGTQGATGLQGAVGAAGSNGTQGATGATGSAGIQGVAGSTGAQGATGADGSQGSTGATGSTGSQGLKGDTGTTGVQGIQGVKGDTGTTGATGAQGTTGAAGATGNPGAQGTTGAAGVSSAKMTSVTFIGNLAGTAGSKKISEPFGEFAAGASYVVRLIINTYDVNSSLQTYGIGITLAASGDSPSIDISYAVMNGTVYIPTNRFYISIIADVVLNGAATTQAYTLIATLTSGASVSASIALTGKCTQMLVGSVG
ncbi:MAG: collagen-like repeat preface domain-containing protein [Actinobacteria bacterium]|nr:collagen-like repeat preface domain-containing protein [Actinomycetota bacterium]